MLIPTDPIWRRDLARGIPSGFRSVYSRPNANPAVHASRSNHFCQFPYSTISRSITINHTAIHCTSSVSSTLVKCIAWAWLQATFSSRRSFSVDRATLNCLAMAERVERTPQNCARPFCALPFAFHVALTYDSYYLDHQAAKIAKMDDLPGVGSFGDNRDRWVQRSW